MSMLKQWSQGFYRAVYKKGIYDEPQLTFMPIVQGILVDGQRPKRILDAACGFANPYIDALVNTGKINAQNLVGIDIDESVKQKNKIHHDIRIQDIHDPMGDHEFDAAISLYTWEHLQDPKQALANFHQALKTGGQFIIIAPQRYHYISTAERMLPKFLKDFAWRLLKGTKFMPYPAFFRLCTKKSLQKAADECGFELKHYRAIADAPTWFAKIPPLFIIMCLVMTMFNTVPAFENLRSVFIAVLVKKET